MEKVAIRLAVATRQGWKDIIAAIHRSAPPAAQRYKGWLKTAARLKVEEPEHFPERELRGQPDLDSQIVDPGTAIFALIAAHSPEPILSPSKQHHERHRIRIVKARHADHLTICRPRELSLSQRDRLQSKANDKTACGELLANGKVVTVKNICASGETELTD